MNKAPRLIKFLIFALLFALSYGLGTAQTQNHLILKKNGYHNRLQYFSGDEISFIRKGNSYIETGILQGIGKDCIIVIGQEIRIDNISTLVFYRTSFNFNAGGQTILVAAPLYLILGAINALLQNMRPIWTTVNLIVAGSIAATGIVIGSLQVRKFHLGKKFQLRIVQSDPMLNH
jgi:hypothetical protein